MSQGKVVVTALINGQWQWRAEAPIDPKLIRRMTKEELNHIAKEAVATIAAHEVSNAADSVIESSADRKKKR